MARPGSTALDPIVLPDSDGEAEHGQPDTSDDAAFAEAIHRAINANRFFVGFYYESGDEETDGKRKRRTGLKARRLRQTPQARADQYGAARRQRTVASSTVTRAVSGATLDTRGRPASAPPGFSASQAQAGPVALRSASAPAGLIDLGDVSSELGDDTLVTSFRAITLLDKMTSPSTTKVKSPVLEAYLPVVQNYSEDQLVATLGTDPAAEENEELFRIHCDLKHAVQE